MPGKKCPSTFFVSASLWCAWGNATAPVIIKKRIIHASIIGLIEYRCCWRHVSLPADGAAQFGRLDRSHLYSLDNGHTFLGTCIIFFSQVLGLSLGLFSILFFFLYLILG